MANEVIKINRPFTAEELGTQSNIIKINRPFTSEELGTQSNPKGSSALSKITRMFMGASPIESAKTITEAGADVPDVTPGESLMSYLNKVKTAPKLVARENAITSKGTLPQFGNLMEAGLAVSGVTAPLKTAKMLGKFGALEGVSQVTGLNKAIQSIQQPDIRDVADIAKFGAQGVVAGQKWTPKPNKSNLINQATNSFRNMLRPNQGEVKNIEIRQGKNINDLYKLAAEEQLPIKQTADKKLDTSLAREKLNTKLTEINTTLGEALKSDRRSKFDLVTIGQKAKNELQGSIKNATELKNAEKQVDEYIADEINNHGRYVNGEQLNTIKQGMWSVAYDNMKPTAKSNARKIGYIAKEMIEKGYPDKNIKQLNELSSKYATLSDLLENAQGRVIQGGKMGKYFAQTTGAITGAALGSAVPIPGVGTAAGALAGKWAGGRLLETLESPERVSKIASKKAGKAGIAGKTYKDVMNYKYKGATP